MPQRAKNTKLMCHEVSGTSSTASGSWLRGEHCIKHNEVSRER